MNDDDVYELLLDVRAVEVDWMEASNLMEVGSGLRHPLFPLQLCRRHHWFQTDVVEHVQMQYVVQETEDSVTEIGAY
jgi:hypothetical protein